MNDDELLRRMGSRMEGPGVADDERLLERFALGELNRDETLQCEQRRVTDPEFARRLELYRPFDARETATFVEHATALSTGRKSRTRPRLGIALGGFALAAAFLLVLLVRGTHARRDGALPVYRVEIERSQGTERKLDSHDGERPAILRWSSESPLILLLRPAVAHQHPVDVRVFVREHETSGASREWQSFRAQTQKSANGVLRITLSAKPPWPRGSVGFALFEPPASAPDTLPRDALDPERQFQIDYEWFEQELRHEPKPPGAGG